MGNAKSVSGLATIPTIALGSSDRSIGRLANIDLLSEPGGDSQADLAADVFMDMFKTNPKFVDDIPDVRQVNHSLINWMRENHGYQKSRANTVGNLPASMIASSLMWEHLNNDETLKDILSKQEEADKAQEEADAQKCLQDALESAASMSKSDKKSRELKNQAGKAGKASDKAQAAATASAKEAMQMLKKAKGNPKKAASMAYGIGKAGDAAKEVAESMAGWGMGSGSATSYDPRAALEFMRLNKGKLALIAKLAGRMRGVALDAKKSRVVDSVIPNEVNHTRDFTNMFGSELVKFSPDAPVYLRASAMGQYADTGMIGFKPNATKDERGPFVGAVDVSPSMRGTREIVAKAVALGLAQSAKEDGRKYILFTFASDPTTITPITDEDSWQKHLEWASSSQRGGTDFDMAITAAMEMLSDLSADKADCMFISDGEAPISTATSDRWRDFVDDSGARLFYVPVGRGGYIDIETLSDRVIELSELDEEAGTRIAQALGGI